MLTQWTVFLKTEVGRRSLQSAFSFPLEVDPLAYHRILRLPLAKGALQDSGQFPAFFCDIGARFEFCNSSIRISH